jgi:hypothetical protein
MLRVPKAFGCCAAVAVLALPGVARAGTVLDVRPGGTVEAVSLFEMESVIFNLVRPRVVCRVTLELRIEDATKTRGVVFGSVGRATATGCTEGTLITFLGLPWRISYQSITGELPSEIAEWLMKIHGAQVLLRGCGWGCLYRGDIDVFLPLFHTLMEEPYVNQLLRTSAALSREVVQEGECPGFLLFQGEFRLRPTQTIVDI